MNLLHIDASILGGNSVSRKVSAAIVERLRETVPDLRVTYRDLAAAPLPHLSGDNLAAVRGAVPEGAALQEDILVSQKVLDEFLVADTVVIGAPMYNFTHPEPAQDLDRPDPRGRQDLPLHRRGPAGARRQQEGDHRHLAWRLLWPGDAGSGGGTSRNLSAHHIRLHRRDGFSRSSPPKESTSGPEQREKSLAGALGAATDLRAA